MKIEAVRIDEMGCGPSAGNPSVNDMVTAKVGVHHRTLAHVLGTAAAWAYADIDTFSRAMCHRAYLGPHEVVGVNASNDSLLVDTTAYLLQTKDKRLAILCFRGTEFKNATNWITDMSASAELFLSTGRVHGGFLRATQVVWRTITGLLDSTRNGSLCEAAAREKGKFVDCIADSAQPGGVPEPTGGGQAPAPAQDRLEALFITGHSLGGAMAVIAAALLYADPNLAYFQDKLHGIYTFGQPLVGYKDFVESAGKQFGDKLFRHVYGKDLITRLPPLSAGPFEHFGSEYVSSPNGWRYQTSPQGAVGLVVPTLVIGLLAWLQLQLPEVPLLRRLNPRWSLTDHGPIYYLRTSQAPAAGTELL